MNCCLACQADALSSEFGEVDEGPYDDATEEPVQSARPDGAAREGGDTAAGARVLEEALRKAAAEAPSGARPATGVIVSGGPEGVHSAAVPATLAGAASEPPEISAPQERMPAERWKLLPGPGPRRFARGARPSGSCQARSRHRSISCRKAPRRKTRADPALAWKPASKSFSRSSRRTPWRRCCPERPNRPSPTNPRLRGRSARLRRLRKAPTKQPILHARRGIVTVTDGRQLSACSSRTRRAASNVGPERREVPVCG